MSQKKLCSIWTEQGLQTNPGFMEFCLVRASTEGWGWESASGFLGTLAGLCQPRPSTCCSSQLRGPVFLLSVPSRKSLEESLKKKRKSYHFNWRRGFFLNTSKKCELRGRPEVVKKMIQRTSFKRQVFFFKPKKNKIRNWLGWAQLWLKK